MLVQIRFSLGGVDGFADPLILTNVAVEVVDFSNIFHNLRNG